MHLDPVTARGGGFGSDLFVGLRASHLVPEGDDPVAQVAARPHPGDARRKRLLAECPIGRNRVTLELCLGLVADEALLVDQAYQYADGVGAAAESEGPDAVVLPVVAAEEFVQVEHVALHADA